MWPSTLGSRKNVSHQQLYSGLKEDLAKLGIDSQKVAPTFRAAAVQERNAAGAADALRPVSLLAAAGWPGAASNELNMFWHERFMIPVPNELVVLLFPFLQNLEKAVQELGEAASSSIHAAPQLLQYLARVVVQDAAGGMCRMHPEHDVHRLLNSSPVFR